MVYDMAILERNLRGYASNDLGYRRGSKWGIMLFFFGHFNWEIYSFNSWKEVRFQTSEQIIQARPQTVLQGT